MKKDKITAGFTFIELLVGMVILTILAGAVLTLQYIIGQNQVSVFRNYLTVEDTNSIVSAFSRELRNATNGANGSYPLITLSDQEIIFYSDYNFDGKVERIRYTVNGTLLEKGIIEPTTPPVSYPLASERKKNLTTSVQNGITPVFYYYNKNWPQDTVNNPLALAMRLADTQLIKISLTLNTKANDPIRNYTIDAFTQVRLLKSND